MKLDFHSHAANPAHYQLSLIHTYHQTELISVSMHRIRNCNCNCLLKLSVQCLWLQCYVFYVYSFSCTRHFHVCVCLYIKWTNGVVGLQSWMWEVSFFHRYWVVSWCSKW